MFFNLLNSQIIRPLFSLHRMLKSLNVCSNLAYIAQQIFCEITAVENQIIVNIAEQRLQLLTGDTVVMNVAIASAKDGVGEQAGSERTPRGRHQVRAMIGGDAQTNAVFIGRRTTGEIYTPGLRQTFPGRDWILTRILWLSGLEPGKNRLGTVDTMRRYIYIHGCPDEDKMGVPGSHGCVKMHNADVIRLFSAITPGTPVFIGENGLLDD